MCEGEDRLNTEDKPVSHSAAPAWDFRNAVCKLSLDDIQSADDQLLLALLQSAPERETIDLLFNEFYSRFHVRVVTWCSRIAGPERGLDLSQEVFLRAYRYRHRFRGVSRVSTWLYAITRNHCLNALRRTKSDPLGKTEVFPSELADGLGSAHDLAEQAQGFEHMWRIIDATLTPLEKRVMTLHYGHELTLPAITRALMLCNPSGAKAYIVNARRKLKKVMAERLADSPAARAA